MNKKEIEELLAEMYGLVSVKQLAEYLGLSNGFIYRMRKTGKLNPVNPDNRGTFSKAAVVEMLYANPRYITMIRDRKTGK